MATPEEPPKPEGEKKKASAAKKRGNKKAVKKVVKKHGRKEGDKTAREYAIEYLKAHHGKAPFGELTNWVSEKLGGNLSWVPTYYMKSPGFSRPERGIVAFSQKDYDAGKAEITKARKERLAKARPKKGEKKAGKASKKKKPETVLERRQRTAKEKAENEAEIKAEFDEAEAKNNGK